MRTFGAAISVLLMLSGCSTTTDLGSTTQPPQNNSTTSYSETVRSTLGTYYDNTVYFIVDDCGVAGYSKAAGIATAKGIGESVFSATKATLSLGLHAYSDEGIILSAAIGSGMGLIDGVKKAYNDFKWETSRCS